MCNESCLRVGETKRQLYLKLWISMPQYCFFHVDAQI